MKRKAPPPTRSVSHPVCRRIVFSAVPRSPPPFFESSQRLAERPEDITGLTALLIAAAAAAAEEEDQEQNTPHPITPPVRKRQ